MSSPSAIPTHRPISRLLLVLSGLCNGLAIFSFFQPFFRLVSVTSTRLGGVTAKMDGGFNAFGYLVSGNSPIISLSQLNRSSSDNPAIAFVILLTLLIGFNLICFFRVRLALKYSLPAAVFNLALVLVIMVWTGLALDYNLWTSKGSLKIGVFRVFIGSSFYVLLLSLIGSIILSVLGWFAIKRPQRPPGIGSSYQIGKAHRQWPI